MPEQLSKTAIKGLYHQHECPMHLQQLQNIANVSALCLPAEYPEPDLQGDTRLCHPSCLLTRIQRSDHKEVLQKKAHKPETSRNRCTPKVPSCIKNSLYAPCLILDERIQKPSHPNKTSAVQTHSQCLMMTNHWLFFKSWQLHIVN